MGDVCWSSLYSSPLYTASSHFTHHSSLWKVAPLRGEPLLCIAKPKTPSHVSNPSTEFLDLQTALAGEYSLQRELGRGGMGVVYLAREVQLDRDVAIKVLPAHLAQMPEARERFIREARTAAGLSPPHIV